MLTTGVRVHGQIRDQLVRSLGSQHVGVLSTAGTQGAWAMPVRYFSRELEIFCLVPRWADVAFHVEQCPRALLVVQLSPELAGNGRLCYLQYQGIVRAGVRPDWGAWGLEIPGCEPGDLFQALMLAPRRIDLIDESLGWGARETWEVGVKGE